METSDLRFSADLGPDDIRMLRGPRSRSEFAELLGVTALTVYRWELPDHAPQARRPRGKVAARIAAFASSLDAPDARAPSPSRTSADASESSLDLDEQGELLPLLERVSLGELRAVEAELLTLMVSGKIRSASGRVLTAQALARVILLAHADVCGALAIIAPLLPELGHLPAAVELEMRITAALIFSWPDGRFFDPGKANAHIIAAEPLVAALGMPESRLLLTLARLSIALMHGEAGLIAGTLAQATELSPGLPSPVHRTLLREAEALNAIRVGRTAAAGRSFQELAESGSLPISRVRALSQLAILALEDGKPSRDVLAIIERARTNAHTARLPSGLHTVSLAIVEGRALLRCARFDEAARVLGEAVDIAMDVRWPPAYAALGLTHVYFCTGRADALRKLGQRLESYQCALGQNVTRAVGSVLTIAATLLDGERNRVETAMRLEEQMESLAADVPWIDLRGELVLFAAVMISQCGPAEQAHRALRRAERHFQQSPSVWATAVLRRSRGIVLAGQGQFHEARELVQSSLGTLTLAEDLGGAAHARVILALIDDALGVSGAAEQVEQHRSALQRLGFALRVAGLDGYAANRGATAGVAARAASPIEQLVAPIQRLTVRGMSPALVQRELMAIVTERFQAATVHIEELDSTGRATLLQHSGVEGAAITEWAELSDGAGRRLRLGIGGAGIDRDAHALLAVFASVAELGLELATLRSVGGNMSLGVAALHEGDAPEIPGFISVSAPMRQLKADLARLSRSRATVIIGGESGSGKEVVARAIHDLSTRAGKPYVAFNCAAVPRDLFEGQLFGYRKGAFTGATTDQPGVLRSADGGTVLLDEIGELPLDVQPKLLRFLENGEVLPLGERMPIKLDVRVIAATYRDLAQLVREGRFREDLYYRLQVVPLHVPPLRERPQDIVALARHFVRQLSPAGHEPPVLAPDAILALNAHRWPGNVRELRNVIERSLAFEPLPVVLRAEHLRITPSRDASEPR